MCHYKNNVDNNDYIWYIKCADIGKIKIKERKGVVL